MIAFLLYLPFVIVFVTAAFFILIGAFRKGLWHALCSLGITLLSALCSIPFAKLLAPAVTRGVLEQDVLPIEGEATRAFLLPLLEGFLGGIVSLFLFSFFFLLLCAVLKGILRLWKHPKFTPPATGEKAFRLGGLAVGFVDVLLTVFLLTLPLYATLAASLPIASSFVNSAGGKAAFAEPYLSQTENHPLVSFYGSGVGSAIVDSLDVPQTGESSLEKVADTLGKLSEHFRRYEESEGSKKKEAALELVRFLQDHVVDEPWSYSLFCTVREGAARGDNGEFAGVFAELFEMSEEEFRKNAKPLLENFESALLLEQSLGSLVDPVLDALDQGIGSLLERAKTEGVTE